MHSGARVRVVLGLSNESSSHWIQFDVPQGAPEVAGIKQTRVVPGLPKMAINPPMFAIYEKGVFTVSTLDSPRHPAG